MSNTIRYASSSALSVASSTELTIVLSSKLRVSRQTAYADSHLRRTKRKFSWIIISIQITFMIAWRCASNLMFRMEKTCKTFNIKPNPLNLLINRSLNRKKQFFCIMSTANRQLNKAEDNKILSNISYQAASRYCTVPDVSRSTMKRYCRRNHSVS